MLKTFKLNKQFGLWFTLISITTFILRKITPNASLYHIFHKYKYKLVNSYIENKYSNLIEKYKEKDKYSNNNELISDYIWILWWQGIEEAPILVKRCVERIEKEKNVIILDKFNYQEYIKIPSEIINKVNEGKLTFTYFSDILRFSLLAKYGGVWIDPTCYITDLSIIRGKRFVTVKHNLFNKWHVSRGRWSSFFIGSAKNKPAICLIRDILLRNAVDTDIWMAYLFTDSALSVAYHNLPTFRKEVDSLPINNTGVFSMEKQLDDLYYDNYVIPERINKLSYKTKHAISKNDQLTVYGALINRKI